MSDCLRLSMWSGPRNISTAIMYAFRQRPDTMVFDEPLYGHYLATTGLAHVGAQDVLAAMDNDGRRVVETVLLGECERPIRFYKNMAHHLVGLDLSFLSGLTNILLTRNPREMLVSLTKVVPDADVDATGLPAQIAVLEHIEKAGGTPIVLDATEVLQNPGAILRMLCDSLGIPFTDAMLSWPTGPKREDGVWAPHWYANVHQSTGFAPYSAKTDLFPAQLEPLLAECAPLFDRLEHYAIRVA